LSQSLSSLGYKLKFFEDEECPLAHHGQNGLSLTGGIDKHQVEGVTVLVYSAAKTLADCFQILFRIRLFSQSRAALKGKNRKLKTERTSSSGNPKKRRDEPSAEAGNSL
jgi:hypothetical protein